MRVVITNIMLVCLGLVVLSMMFTGISSAGFDLNTVVGMWLFDEGQGNTTADYSDNGNDGKLVNGPKWIKNGKFDSALEFDGNASKGHVVVGNLGLSGKITLVMWGNPTEVANDDRLMCNINGPTNPAFAIRYQNGAVEIWGTAWKPVIPKFDENKWGHYAFVFDGEGNVTGYYNGKEGNTVNDTFAFTDIGIGANFLDQWGQYYSGQFDEVAFFDVSLTEADINSLMTKGFEAALEVTPSSKLTTTWANIKAFTF